MYDEEGIPVQKVLDELLSFKYLYDDDAGHKTSNNIGIWNI